MPDTVGILGQYLYQADVLPRGARNWRRALIAATTEYEIRSVSTKDVEHDAMVFVPGVADTPVQLTELPESGRLFRHAGLDAPLRLDDYRTHLACWASTRIEVNPLFPGIEPVPLKFDPIATAHGPDDGHHWPKLGGLDVYVEDGFRGTIGVSDKAAAHARHTAAARHVLVIDGVVHYAAMPPAWLVERHKDHAPTITLVDRLPGFGRMGFNQPQAGKLNGGRRTLGSVGLGLFSPDRLDDARAWARSQYPSTTVIHRGEVLRTTHSQAPAHPMIAPMHCMLESILSLIESCRNHLNADAYATWGLLHTWGRRFAAYGNDEIPPLPGALEGLIAIRDSLAGRMLPADTQHTAVMLVEHIDALSARAAFERNLTPNFTDEDDLALSSAGTARLD